MRGIQVEWIPPGFASRPSYDEYRIKKSRGKITLADIQDAMGEKNLEGLVVVMLRVGSDLYTGWNDDAEPKGDIADVVLITEDGDCPICAKTVPLIQWCPHCGRSIDTLREQEDSQ